MEGNKFRNDRGTEQNNRNNKLLSRWQIAGINEGRVVFSSTTSVCAAVKGSGRMGTGVASLAWFVVYCRGERAKPVKKRRAVPTRLELFWG